MGDLKRVLANVKVRGTWGEVQLCMLLEQVLTPEQYEANVACKEGSAERVEYAIRLPGYDGGGPVWLPIDAKFPVEDYQRMLEAQGQGDARAVEQALRGLESRVKLSAKDIQCRYLDPPRTTDFAIMFLPTEGLYAEVLRRPGPADSRQRDHRVVVAGPTTLAALLNSLQMGFRTLAIEKRSSEVWHFLGWSRPVRPLRRATREGTEEARPGLPPPSKTRPEEPDHRAEAEDVEGIRVDSGGGSCSREKGSWPKSPVVLRRGRSRVLSGGV